MMPIGYYANKKDETSDEDNETLSNDENIFEKIIDKNNKQFECKNNVKLNKPIKIKKQKKKERTIIADALVNPENYRTHQYNKFYDQMMDEFDEKSNNSSSSSKKKKKIIKKKVIKRKKPDIVEHSISMKKYVDKINNDPIDLDIDFKI
jgi:hypothetical protein